MAFPSLKDCTFLTTSHAAKDIVIRPGWQAGHRRHSTAGQLATKPGLSISRFTREGFGDKTPKIIQRLSKLAGLSCQRMNNDNKQMF